MPVSYPAVVPTSGVTSLQWTNSTASLISRSPFTFQGQAQAYPGAIRSAQITVENLNREQAEDWVGFLDSLHGTLGTFLFGDPMAAVPMGSARGTATILAINSVTQDIFTVNTNLTAPTLNYLRRGDWLQLRNGVDSRLYKVTAPVNVNSEGHSGNINIWPKFRVMPQIGHTVFFENPKGLFRRSSGSFNYTESNGCKYDISFDCEEVI